MKKVILNIYKNFSVCKGNDTLYNVLMNIKDGRVKKQVVELRTALAEGRKEEAEKLKKQLPAFTLSATYKGARRPECIERYNGWIILDIDKVGEDSVDGLMKAATEIPYTMFCFRSPSGNGLKIGVKPVVSFELTLENHARTFAMVADFYAKTLKVKIDTSGKDVGRLCFMSYDPNIYIKTDTEGYETLPFIDGGPLPVSDTGAAENKAEEEEDEGSAYLKFRNIRRWVVRKNGVYGEGIRNNYLFDFSYRCSQEGFSYSLTLSYCLKSFNDLPIEEIVNTVSSAFSYTQKKRGKYEKQATNEPKTSQKQATNEPKTGHKQATNEPQTGQFQVKQATNRPQTGQKGKSSRNKQNSVLIIKEFLKKRYELRINTVTDRVEWKKRNTEEDFECLNEIVFNSWWCHLQNIATIHENDLRKVLYSDFSPKFNPYKDFFGNLPVWDGKTDYIGMLADTVVTTNTVLWNKCLKKWIVAMVACATEKEVVNHTVLILRSDKQGVGKTTWFGKLLPKKLKDYYYSGTPNFASKDTEMSFSRNIIINVDELDVLSRKEANIFKEMVTKNMLQFRKVYGKFLENFVRCSSICGTTNSRHFLTDVSGSRRFLCFDVESIEYDFKIDHEMLYSQAVALIEQGFVYWLTPDEISDINILNDKYRERTPHEEFAMKLFRKPDGRTGENPGWYSASDISKHIYCSTGLQISFAGNSQIGRLMHREAFRMKTVHGISLYQAVQKTAEELDNEKAKQCEMLDSQLKLHL